MLGFLFLLVYRAQVLAEITTWTLLLSFPLVLGALGYFFYSLNLAYVESSADQVVEEGWQDTAFFVTAIVLWVAAGSFVALLLFIRR